MKKLIYLCLPVLILTLLGSCNSFSNTSSYENLQATNDALKIELTVQSSILATQNAQVNQPQPVIVQPLPQISNTDEARIRYIIADIQLGGVYDYYQSASDQEAIEAVRRWDQGIKVANISYFDRKIVGNLGWQIVYIGTDSSVNGMDIELTSPPVYLSPTPLSNQPPIIDRVELRYDRSSGKLVILQDVFFSDIDGDANYVHYQLISVTSGATANTKDGSINMTSDQKYGSVITGKWSCGGNYYDVTLEVTIYDQAGHASNSVRYTMSCN